MNKLSRVSESVVVQLNTLEDNQIDKASYLTVPLELLDESIVRIDTLDDVDLEIEEEVVKNYLVDNIEDDFACAVKIYQTFKRMDNLTLLDNKLWTYYSVNAFWEYTFKRFFKEGVDSEKFSSRAILVNSQMDYMLNNSISRLWWIAHLTRDPKAEDKYALTKYILDNQIFIDTLFKLPQFKNLDFIQTFFKAYHLVDDREWKIKKEDEIFVKSLYEYLGYTSIYSLIDLYDVADILKLVENFYENEFVSE